MGAQPTHLFYLTSLRCNERCTKCSHWKVRQHPRMVDVEDVARAVLSVPSAEEFCIVGGEPLLFRDRVLHLVHALAATNVRIIIVTNGVQADETFLEHLVDRRVHLVFSIDTLDPERWKWIRGTDRMEKVIANFEAAVRLLQPPQISVQSVLAEETRQDIAEVAEWCERRGIYHSVQDYVADGFGGSWTPRTDGLVRLGRRDVQAASAPCAAAERNLSIMPDGSVFTCFQQPLIPDSEAPLGRLGDQPIEEILTSEYAQAVTDRMLGCNLPCKVLKCNQSTS
ncbi:MAG: radical SAM protein [Deltaproteobacteria bacterium]|nr:radical SAM protein [Deltaproteobacteria bacterium]